MEVKNTEAFAEYVTYTVPSVANAPGSLGSAVSIMCVHALWINVLLFYTNSLLLMS